MSVVTFVVMGLKWEGKERRVSEANDQDFVISSEKNVNISYLWQITEEAPKN